MCSLNLLQPHITFPSLCLPISWTPWRASRKSKSSKKNYTFSKDSKYLENNNIKELLKNLGFENKQQILSIVNSHSTSNLLDKTFVSSTTFFENKHGFPECQLNNNFKFENKSIISPFPTHTLLNHYEQIFLEQRRHFRPKNSPSKISLKDDKLFNDKSLIFGFKNMFDKLSGNNTAISGQSDKFKTILGDINSSSNTSIQEKIKVAFAEGYLANNAGKKEPVPTGTLWMRRLSKVFWYALLCWLIFQFIQLYTPLGGNVKISVLKGDRFEINPEEITITFNDVKGMDEAKQELKDIVEFLREPEKFKNLGAKLPKGVLLVGPPGIGKSLLARAVAGESGVPFFHASGSEFDEIFVGTGAKRIRQLFDSAKARSPCIVFIDEIDSVGAKRTSSQIHPYANQTINQLLSEMDGFTQNEGIIVLGATNRRDNLDKALLRPGRFDVEVRVFPPDLKGRRDILEHYLSKVKKGLDIDTDQLARSTTGCTGADLENLVNQAALKAAIDGDPNITMIHLDYARDKVLMGPAKKTKIPDEATNLLTAYHEAGHTLVAYFTKDATPLNKVTIIPRGTSLGHTSFVPDKEHYNLTKSQLLAQLDVAMGGRVAEELIYGSDFVTTGAQSDFSQATAIATAMVKQYGMSDKVGVRVFHEDDVDIGLSFVKLNEVGPATTELVDNEIKRLLHESYERAKSILKLHATEHKNLAQILLKQETLNFEEVKAVVEGKNVLIRPGTNNKPSNIIIPGSPVAPNTIKVINNVQLST